MLLARIVRAVRRAIAQTQILPPQKYSGSVVLVDDLHWFKHGAAEVQHRALSVADVVMATYAHAIPSMYQASGRNKVVGLRRPHQLEWLPHATTAQYFISLRDPGLIVNQVLLSG